MTAQRKGVQGMKKLLNRMIGTTTIASFLTLGSLVSAPGFAMAASTAQTTSAATDLQNQIGQALGNRLADLEVSYSGNAATLKRDVNRILQAAIDEDDYTHYIVKSYSYKAITSSGHSVITFHFTYWETAEQTSAVKVKVSEILSGIIDEGMNDYQKEKAIHDWIVSHIAYDTSLKSHSAYDGLMLGSTVCQGYALLAYEMLSQAGIPVKIEEGRARGQAHAWNLVQLDGAWYQLDCTWDDPVPDIPGECSMITSI
ncbi:transglutaminase domain-containing protein [Paenibacillus hexagrammi]|uniref:Transglutaminase-like domain-containing protein n=1 Tax=Paenibacillus hexagrammi TaxID=2908839 RepID=A0ABY3SPM9_9BACL|nr:transglutaminase domain-containing protein [Paenibacillus sp. YPD9-1]UJF36007.1 hypothetical protein L0M14_13570 [Paenibacillus sp. YPD9-1]